MKIGFNQSLYVVDEEDENGNDNVVYICIDRNGALERSITVYVTTSDGTAIGELVYI